MVPTKTPNVARETSLDAKGVFMCYEFDELYRKAREEEIRKKKLAEERRDPSPTPAKPVAPEARPKEPVPA
jgi:hypothetical protein